MAAKIRLATQGWTRYKRGDLRLESLATIMEREILTLQAPLQEALAVNGYTSYLRGIADVVGQLPSQAVAKSTTTSPLAALQSLLTDLTVSQVKFPALDTAVATLEAARAMQGFDYRATAELVRQGAFALTGHLTDKGVEQVKATLITAIDEGWGLPEFVEAVTSKLTDENEPLSESHLETIFRTNTLSQISDGQWAAVHQPLVRSYFPYARYYATRDKRVRPHHAELEKLGLDGTNFYNVDDPVFIKYRPIWAYNCRCNWTVATVEQAAKAGVKEAQEWWERALEQAKKTKRTPYECLLDVRPARMQFVTDPGFPIDEGFIRAL